jgi:uncharacterized membrane protein YdfJ with MMPL/SSD domain
MIPTFPLMLPGRPQLRLTLWLAGYLAGSVLILAGLWLAYDWAHDRGVAQERARWESATAEAGARFAEALAAQAPVVVQAERDLTANRRRSNARREDLDDATKTDPAAADWARQPIPDGVRAALGHRRDLPADPR